MASTNTNTLRLSDVSLPYEDDLFSHTAPSSSPVPPSPPPSLASPSSLMTSFLRQTDLASSQLTANLAVLGSAQPPVQPISPSAGGSGSAASHTPKSPEAQDKPHRFRWLLILVILLLLAGLTFLWQRSTNQYSQLSSAQSQLQQALDTAQSTDSLQASELEALTQRIAQLRTELDTDLPKQLEAQYTQLLQQLQSLSQSSDQALASTAQTLLSQLTNQAGEGIGLSGTNNTTIQNNGVISLNNQTGNLSLQGTPNQTTVITNPSTKTVTVGTAQDIAQSSSPTFNNQTLTGSQDIAGSLNVQGSATLQGDSTVQGSQTVGGNLSVAGTATRGSYQLCDSSNNCGYSGAGSSYVQGGNSFGNPATLGTNDSQPLHLRTNGTNRITVGTDGNTSFTGNISTPGSVSAGSFTGNGANLTNVDSITLNGNTAGNSSGQIALNNSTLNTNLNADLLDGQHGSFYQNADNINTGTLSDARLSSNVALQNAANTFSLQQTFNGGFQATTGILSGNFTVNGATTLQGVAATNGTFSGTVAATSVSATSITATGFLQGGNTVCDISNNCNYAASSGSGNYIQNRSLTDAAQSGGFHLSGDGRLSRLVLNHEAMLYDNRSNTIIQQSPNTLSSNRTLRIGNGTYSSQWFHLTPAGRLAIGADPSSMAGTTGRLTVAIGSASSAGIVVRGTSDQTANLQEWQNSDGNALSYMNSAGSLFLSNTSANRITLANTGTSSSIIHMGAGSTTAYNLGKNASGWFVLQNASDASKHMTFVGNTGRFFINAGVGGSSALSVSPAVANDNGIVIRSISGQTGDLLQIQGSSANIIARISASGQIFQGANQVCDTSNNCNYAAATGGAGYIQNQTASPQTAGFNITGNGTIGGALLVQGGISSPGAGANSQVFGLGANATGNNSVVVGVGASASAGSVVVVGRNASTDRLFSVAVGSGATVAGVGNYGTAIGASSSVTGNASIALGYGASATGNQQLVVGGLGIINQGYFGNGVTAASPANFTLNATGGSGTDIQGASLAIAGGRGTGSAAGGDILFQTSAPGATGETLRALTTRMVIQGGTGNVGIGTVDTSQARLTINKGPSGQVGLIVIGSSGHTDHVQQWRDQNGNVLSFVDRVGNITSEQAGSAIRYNRIEARAVSGGNQPYITLGNTGTGSTQYKWAFTSNSNLFQLRSDHTNNNPTWPDLHLSLHYTTGTLTKFSTNADETSTVLRGIAGQTGDFLQAQDSTGAVLASISASGKLTVKSAEVEGDLVVVGSITTTNITVNGKIIGNADTRGTVTVGAGNTTEDYTFTVPYASVPVVVVSPVGDPGVRYWLSDISTTGFRVNMESAPGSDAEFNFMVQQ